MKTTGRVIALVTICAASLAFAKDGVTNEAVIARTDAMQLIRQSTKTLGSMVQGKRAFDPILLKKDLLRRSNWRDSLAIERQENLPMVGIQMAPAKLFYALI